ncbi:MAG: YggT family protein [Pseudomonadota bacterium]
MLSFLAPLYPLFYWPLTILFYMMVAYAIMSWLVVGGVVSMQNQTARSLYRFLASVIEPLAAPIRRYVPPLGMFDMSFFVLFLILIALRDILLPWLFFG